MRFLAIDAGAKRTGLAVGDDRTGIVTPLKVIVAASAAEQLRLIMEAIAEHAPGALVLGLPLHMAESAAEGPAAKSARQLADQLRQIARLEVFLVDERLSSYAADQQMARTGLTRGQKKSRRDAMAAAIILRDFLDKNKKPPTREP